MALWLIQDGGSTVDFIVRIFLRHK